MYRYFLLITFSLLITLRAFPQSGFENEPRLAALLEQAVDYVYNADLENFDRIAEQVRQMKPDHPVYPMLRALSLRSAYYPIEVGSAEFEKMRTHLEQVVVKAEAILDEDEDEPVANFFALASLGLLAMYENDAGNTIRAVGYAKDAYDYLQTGFDLKEKYVEFYFSTGLYNYYRIKYPELRPIYKTFTWFFRDGDLDRGLEQLDRAYRASVFMRPEAASYLSHIYLHYEDKPYKAYPYARQMVQSYPDNPMFIVSYLEASVAADRLSGLDQYVKQLQANPKTYFQMVGLLYEATLLEKRERQWQEAEQFYQRAIARGQSLNSDEASHFRSYAYAGMARIADHQKNYAAARSLYKDALSYARYPSVKAEAEAYLN